MSCSAAPMFKRAARLHGGADIRKIGAINAGNTCIYYMNSSYGGAAVQLWGPFEHVHRVAAYNARGCTCYNQAYILGLLFELFSLRRRLRAYGHIEVHVHCNTLFSPMQNVTRRDLIALIYTPMYAASTSEAKRKCRALPSERCQLLASLLHHAIQSSVEISRGREWFAPERLRGRMKAMCSWQPMLSIRSDTGRRSLHVLFLRHPSSLRRNKTSHLP